jgi:lipopolysaccharide export system protein LptA
MNKTSVFLCSAVALSASYAPAQTQPATAPESNPLTVTLDADSTEADATTGMIRFTGVTIAQGDLSVSARLAQSSSLDFADSTWTFTGDVRFASADTRLQAERATLRFASQALTRADLEGAPLVFEQSRNGEAKLTGRTGRLEFRDGELANAMFSGAPVNYEQRSAGTTTSSRADTLSYDAKRSIINLQGHAWIGGDGKEISGNSITYNLATRSYAAASDDNGDQRVTITITPPAKDDTGPR